MRLKQSLYGHKFAAKLFYNLIKEGLMKKVEDDDKVFLVVGDLGYTVVDPLVEKYPKRVASMLSAITRWKEETTLDSPAIQKATQ